MGRRSTAIAPVAASDFTALIAERAYFKAEQRGFAPGHELEDWLAAERELETVAAPVVKRKKPAARRKTGPKTGPKNGSVKKLK